MTKTTPSDASRIQSSQTLGGHDHGKGSFASRTQSSAARNANAGIVPGAGRSAGGSGGAARISGASAGGGKSGGGKK